MKQGLVFFLICGLVILAGCALPMNPPTIKQGVNLDQNSILEIGYAFLVRDQAEEEGYGLYSYLLFGCKPTDANRDLYIQAISACVERFSKIKHLEEIGFQRRELNVTYIPIHEPTPTTEGGLSPEWILEHYDYERARLLLKSLPGAYSDGPYIISTFNPLSSYQTLSKGYFHQDLSKIPPARSDLIHAWVKEFLERVSRPENKNEFTMKRLVTKIRIEISIAAESLPEIISALNSLIAWVK